MVMRQRTLLLICALIVSSIGGWMLFDYGRWRMIYQEMSEAFLQKTQEDLQLSEQQKKMENELEEFRSKATILERISQVDRAAQNEVRKVISKLEKENLELREELGFYQNIMASTSQGRGLKIQGFRLEPSKIKQRYQFELILTRIVKGGRLAEGDISITIQGSGKSGQIDYDLQELLVGNDANLSFDIKHFKRIGGVFALPEDFVPDTVKVVVQSREKKAKAIKKTYQWIDIIA